MREQVDLVRASIAVSSDVAALLASYSVGAAEELIDGEGGRSMPAELRDSYRHLLQNLKAYKPYERGPARRGRRGGRGVVFALRRVAPRRVRPRAGREPRRRSAASA
eukprot:gene7112-3528_t